MQSTPVNCEKFSSASAEDLMTHSGLSCLRNIVHAISSSSHNQRLENAFRMYGEVSYLFLLAQEKEVMLFNFSTQTKIQGSEFVLLHVQCHLFWPLLWQG